FFPLLQFPPLLYKTHVGFYQDVQVLQFPESSVGLKRRKREWVIPPINFPENDNGPFPKALVQIKSNKSEEVNITYSITGEGADRPPVGLFTINRDTGWLYVTKPVDREFKNKYVLQAHAVAAKGEGEAPIKFIINMIDVNDNVPVFTRSIYKVRVPEATPIGHEFMKVTATDADDPNTENADIRYYIFSQNPVEPNPNMFNINPVTGAIRVSADGLDRENYSAYELRIRAADMMGSGRTSIAKVLIEVTDSNDNAPKFEKTSYTVSVPENTVGAVVVKMAVTDGDEPQTPAWTAKFRIIQGDTSGVYKVSTGPNKQEGIITAVKPLDFETNPKYTLLVVVENDVPFAKPMTTSTATVTVNVPDVNEAPVFDPEVKEVSVPEDTAVGSQLTVFTATDPDTARTQTVMYRVGADAAGWVSVDGETGVVKVKSPMDRESDFVKDGKYRALILAVDDDQVPATGTGTLLINLAAVNSPIIEEKMITVCSKEPAPVLLSVTDKDGPGFAAPFKVELQGESRNYWTAEMDKNGNGPTTSIAMRENVIAAECEMIFSVRLVMLQALNPEADSSPQLRNTGSDLEKDVLAVADVPVLQFPGSSVGLKRRKRELVIPPINFPENDNGPFPKQIAQIKSSKAKAVSITYSISGGGADLPPVGLFTINRNNGWFSVTKPLDREVKNNYVLQVHAVADEGEGEAPMEIIVNVIDMNDNTPVFTQDTFHGFLSEASAIGLEFMKVTATDADDPNTDNADIRYSIISQNPVEPNPNMFDINPVTGAIRVKAEGLNREKYPEYTLEVQAADMAGRGLTALAKAVVNVTHSNDNAPEFEKTSYTVSLPENIVGAVVVKMVVTDGDEPQTPAWTAKFRIIQGDTSGVFRVSTGPNKQEGIITTVKPLDFEGAPKYTLLVVVENDIPFDSPMNTSTATVTVNVLDVNDPPVFDPQEKVISVPEGKAVDSQPIEYTATDQDKARGQKVMYHVGADAAGWVSVDGETGVVKVKSPMDRESHFVKDGKYRALILAVDDDQVPATGTGTLLINLEDVNDNSPVIKEKMITVCSKEPAPVLLSVTDKDGPGFAAPFKVELQGECMDHWTAEMIEKGTGILLTPKTALNEGKYSITLRVYDNSRLHQDHTVLATVHECMRIVEYFCLRFYQDVPVLQFPESSVGLKRRNREWVIPPINITENDRGPFPKQMDLIKKFISIKSTKSKDVKITYNITGEGADMPPVGLFTINRTTGWLYVTEPLDREDKDKYVLQAHAVAAEGEGEAPMEIIVNVIDMNDNKPVFTQDSYFGRVPEATPIGYDFMKVTATDADDPNTDNADIRYSIISQNPVQPNPNMFDINPVTGAIRVKAEGLNREKYPQYILEIKAADMKGSGLTAFSIAIVNVTPRNNNAPKFENTSYTVSFPENAFSGGVLMPMGVTDGDEPQTPAWTAKFRIIQGDSSGVFSVSSMPNQEIMINIHKPLDFETNPKYTLLVVVENDVPFAKPMPTSTATVTVNVEDVNEAPVFDPQLKVIYVPEDTAVGSQLTVFTATDPDTARAQTVTYRVDADPADWVSVDGETGVVKVKNPMDRESHFVKDGIYYVFILAVDDDQVPAIGAGTLLINLAAVNFPVIEQKIITVCNKEPAPVLLSLTDKDGQGFAAPFKVELQGESRNYWMAEMDQYGTGIVLTPSTALDQGKYNITLRVYDNSLLFQDHTVLAIVHECIGEVEHFCLKA
ncbi:uncharacterized protein, partial [Hoplias malabaricus]|uniref:uncharacterized protein n=1 Tax=Hoplias malabaricus TaxID=27720 RepID=UPI003462A0DB